MLHYANAFFTDRVKYSLQDTESAVVAVQHASAAASRRVQRGHGTDSISICRVKTINTLFTLIARAQ